VPFTDRQKPRNQNIFVTLSDTRISPYKNSLVLLFASVCLCPWTVVSLHSSLLLHIS